MGSCGAENIGSHYRCEVCTLIYSECHVVADEALVDGCHSFGGSGWSSFHLGEHPGCLLTGENQPILLLRNSIAHSRMAVLLVTRLTSSRCIAVVESWDRLNMNNV